MGNGVSTQITHSSNALIQDKRQLYLNDLLRVPQTKKNLISVSQFDRDNDVFFEFYPDYCVVKDILTKKILLQGNAFKDCTNLIC